MNLFESFLIHLNLFGIYLNPFEMFESIWINIWNDWIYFNWLNVFEVKSSFSECSRQSEILIFKKKKKNVKMNSERKKKIVKNLCRWGLNKQTTKSILFFLFPSKLSKCTRVQFQRADEDALCWSSKGSFLMDVLVVHVVESGLFSWKCSKTLVVFNVSVDLSTVVGTRKSWLSTIFCWEIRHPLLMCQRNSCFKVYIWERNLSANLASCWFSERSWLACWSSTAMRSNLRMRHLEAATRLRARLRSTCKDG